MTNSGRSNSNATGSKADTFIESVHNDGCWFTDFLLPSDVVEQSVLENGDIDTVTSTRCHQWIPTTMLLLLVSWQWNLLAWSSIVIGIHWWHRVDVTILRYRLLNQANRFHCQETSSSSSQWNLLA